MGHQPPRRLLAHAAAMAPINGHEGRRLGRLSRDEADIEGRSEAAKFSKLTVGQIFRHSHTAIAIVQMDATMRKTAPHMPK